MTIQDAALAMIEALHRAGIEYSLVGSLASMYYGITRSTLDAYFVVEFSALGIGQLAAQLPPDFNLDRQPRFELFSGRTYYLIAIHGTPFTIDVFTLSADEFDQNCFARRQRIRLLDREVFAPTAEDVVVQKLRWQRPQDAIDAQNVLAIQVHALDFAYIERWCDAHGTRGLLEKLRSEIPSV